MKFASKSALSYHIKSQHNNKTSRKISRIQKSRFNDKIVEILSRKEF